MMPYGDGTGPWGRGPLTGRGLGYCRGAYGRGFGRGYGPGRGFGGRGGFFRDIEPVFDRYEMRPEDEKNYLEGVVKELEAELEDIKKRMAELSGK